MGHSSTKYTIRNYQSSDADSIGRFDHVAKLTYLYHRDYVPDNIFCCINSSGEVLGVGHLGFHESWRPIENSNMPPDHVYKLTLNVSVSPEALAPVDTKKALYEVLIARARDIKTGYPGKRIRVIKWVEGDDFAEMDFQLSIGLATGRFVLVMKRDLDATLPTIPMPDGIIVRPLRLDTEQELANYFTAETEAFAGETWSLNTVRFMRGAPECRSFGAFAGDELVGHTMTWMINDQRSATEHVFVRPKWRGRGIARYVLVEALKELAARGKQFATLSVRGDNTAAISLYRSLGYKMYYVLLEFGLGI